MLSDLADMSGSGLGREGNKPKEAGDFQGDKEPTEKAEEWTGEVEVQ